MIPIKAIVKPTEKDIETEVKEEISNGQITIKEEVKDTIEMNSITETIKQKENKKPQKDNIWAVSTTLEKIRNLKEDRSAPKKIAALIEHLEQDEEKEKRYSCQNQRN